MTLNVMVVMVLAAVLVAPAISLAQRAQLPVADQDQWFSEVYAGHASGGEFREGHRLGAGVPGAMAFDHYGNAFVAAASFVYAITSDDQVHLLAGVPGIPGSADGPADRACLGGINGIAVAKDGTVYLSDVGNFVVKKLARDKAGAWAVTTIAGQAGVKGHKDGPTGRSLLQRPEGIAIDSRGNVYTMDQDWLVRILPSGQMTTLNPKGGTGKATASPTGPLESARFLRIMGSGPISCDEHDNLYIADKWNMVFWKADLKAGTITNLAGGPVRGTPGFGGRDAVRDGKAADARFHHGGGPSAAVYDRVTGRVYTVTADEHAVRAITPDGWVKTLGPWLNRRARHIGVGPLKETAYRGTIPFRGVDPQGRVYVSQGDVVYRFCRKPAYDKAATVQTPNPLLPFTWRRPQTAHAAAKVTLPSPPDDAKALSAGKTQMVCAGSMPRSLLVTVDTKDVAIPLDPTVASAGTKSLRVQRRLVAKEGEPPQYAIIATVSDGARPAAGPIEIAPSGCNPVVGFDGRLFVVAYEHRRSIYARRIAVDGTLLGAEPIKLGGQWEHRPAIAANGEIVVVTGARWPWPNPWGWNGPGAISIGRLTRDGRTPERFSVDYHQLADGGYAGLLDRAQWKGRPGWPAGAPGGFKATQNGYWPHLYSAVCWDGRTWVAAWVRAKMREMALADFDLFAGRVDPKTMMPVGEPVLVAGGPAEPGTQSKPTLTGLGAGRSLLVYKSVVADGQVRVMACLLAGGPVTGPERIEPRKP